jgi:hypothetical protein
MLEAFVTKNAESAAGDLTADLAALRQDVARLTETIGKLVQHQAQTAGLGGTQHLGDAPEKKPSTDADPHNPGRPPTGEN